MAWKACVCVCIPGYNFAASHSSFMLMSAIARILSHARERAFFNKFSKLTRAKWFVNAMRRATLDVYYTVWMIFRLHGFQWAASFLFTLVSFYFPPLRESERVLVRWIKLCNETRCFSLFALAMLFMSYKCGVIWVQLRGKFKLLFVLALYIIIQYTYNMYNYTVYIESFRT